MAGLITIVVLIFDAFGAPLLANDQPVVCNYKGKLYFPGLVETAANLPLLGRLIEMPKPFGLESFTFKDEFDPERGDWAWWAPVPYSPIELAGPRLESPSRVHWLGTDDVGRDVLSRMIHGTGVSIKIGFISMGIATVIGLLLGATAGYAGGWIDMIISRLIEIVMCFPTFFLILAILVWLPPRIEFVMIVIGLTRWVGIARYARGEILRLRETEFALAAKALGYSPKRVVFRHLIPNALAPVLVSVTFGIASAVLIEAGLSWLGFGVQPPAPSWGNMLRSGYDVLFTASHMIPPQSFPASRSFQISQLFA